MLLSCSVTGRTERHDFEPRQSFDHFFAVSFSAIPCARYSFKDCFTVIFLPRGNEIGSKERDKVQFFAPDGGYFTKRDSDSHKHLCADNVFFATFQYSAANQSNSLN